MVVKSMFHVEQSVKKKRKEQKKIAKLIIVWSVNQLFIELFSWLGSQAIRQAGT
jgi:hypothetical protein